MDDRNTDRFEQAQQYLDSIKNVEGIDANKASEIITSLVMTLKENSLVKSVVDTWNTMSFEDQKAAVHADQSVLDRLLGTMKTVALPVSGSLEVVKSGFLRSMLHYGVIEFTHEGTPEEHEALIHELHIEDSEFAHWGGLFLKGISLFIPDAKPLAYLVDQIEDLLHSNEELAGKVRSNVRAQVRSLEEDIESQSPMVA